MSDLSVADIKAMLVGDIDRLVGELVPGAIKKGGVWAAKNPARAGSAHGSFVVWRLKSGAGAWKDYASGDQGDAIDLVAYLACNATHPFSREARVEAIKWAKGWLGIAGSAPGEIRLKARQAGARQKANQALEEVELWRKYRRALDLWQSSVEIIGTPAEAYLATRGIDLARIPHREASLRYAKRVHHPHEPHVGPAMVGCFTGPTGGFAAVHVTFIKPDGSGKADVSKAKYIFSLCKGAVIRLTKGEDGLTPFEAAKLGVLAPCALAEGIESGLSAAMASPGLRVWAVGSLSNFINVPRLACVSGWIVCAENDAGPQAQAQLESAVEALRRGGLDVALARPLGGAGDLNDGLTGKKERKHG